MLHHARFAALSAGSLLDGYIVVACEGCGLCFADAIPPQSAFDTYYQLMSKYEHQDTGGLESDDDRARHRHVFDVLVPHLQDHSARILEIGCANGGLLALLATFGFANVLGVDPSPLSAKAARVLHGVTVLPGTLSALPVTAERFDVLILAGVLEHVPDLSSVLTRLRGLLAPKGLLYVGVPDASRYVDGEDAPFQEFSVEHINFFGPRSLHNLLATHGFEQVHIERAMMHPRPRTSTPVVHALFRVTADAHVPPQTARQVDDETPDALARYVAKSFAADAHVKRVISEIADSREPLIVWGAGAHTLRLLENSRLREARIVLFVDSNSRYQGKTLHGVPVAAPAALVGRSESILVSSRPYQQEIRDQIAGAMGLPNRVICLY